MKRALSCLLIIVMTIASTSSVFATGKPPGDHHPGGGGDKCSWEGFKNALGEQESGNNYGKRNSANYVGRYQFGEASLNTIGWYSEPGGIACGQCKSCPGSYRVKYGTAMICYNNYSGTWTGRAREFNINSVEDFLANGAAQDAAFDDYMAKTYQYTKKCHNRVGSQACGCTVTLSGILGAAHLGGPGGGCKAANGQSRGDGAATTCGYLCKFADYEVPAHITGGAPEPSSGNCNGCKKVCQTTNNPTPPSGETGGAGVLSEITPDTKSKFQSLSELLKMIWVAAFQLMTSQLSTTMMQQTLAIGAFFDAKHQLEGQRLLQEKHAQAHKDYQPSEQMCEIGTFVRNLADSEQRAKLSQTAFARAALDRALMAGDVKTLDSSSDDYTRRNDFIKHFCNQEDNAKQNKKLCKNKVKPEQENADINFTQTIDLPLTLNVNLVQDASNPETEDEKIEKHNLFAFLDYIFMHDRFTWKSKTDTVLHSFIEPYQDMRSIVAMRSVAQNSFAYIISEKVKGTKKQEATVAPFLRSLMKEMGLEKTEIDETIGQNPSYYAQMEVLTKKIYQHPEFVSNLYDKPANVKRIRAAMTAIKVMQDRDMHKALLRREMLMSLLLELRLRQEQQNFWTTSMGSVSSSPAEEGPSGGATPKGSGVGP